ncbi:unnamed protein product, partial [Staurois parvus]
MQGPGRPDIVNAGSGVTGYSECRLRLSGYSECGSILCALCAVCAGYAVCALCSLCCV